MATVIERKLTTVPDSPDKSLGDSKSGSSASCRHHLTIQGMGISWPFLQGICSSLAPLHWLPVGILDSSTVSEARCDRSTQSQLLRQRKKGSQRWLVWAARGNWDHIYWRMLPRPGRGLDNVPPGMVFCNKIMGLEELVVGCFTMS